jgi:hypothetical protein
MAEVNLNQIVADVQEEGDQKALQEANENDVIAPLIASLDAALTHGNAKKVYLSKKDDPTVYDTCDCCNLPVKGVPVPLTASLKKLYHLGSGFALYFRFIKSVIYLLLIVFCISGIYNIVSSEKTNDCDATSLAGSYCVQGYILSYAVPNKRNHPHQLMIQQALNLVSVIIIMIFFHYIRYVFRKTEIQADDETITPSDYTCVFENIDPTTKEGEFRKWLTDIGKKDNVDLKIVKVNKSYAITEYIKLRNRETVLSKKLNAALKRKGSKTQQEETMIYDTNTELKNVQNQLKDVKSTGIKRATFLYVTFATAIDSDFVQKKFHRSLISQILGMFKPKFVSTFRDLKGRSIKAKRAPEPTDILWENLGYTTKEKTKRRSMTTLLTFIAVCISLGIILLVNWSQNKAIDKFGKGSPVVQGLSIIVSLLISVANAVLAILIDVLTRTEKHITYTNYLKGVAQKLSVAQFLNTALVSLFVELILADDTGLTGYNRLELVNFYGKGGLLENIYWIFITSAFLPPVMSLIDPGFQFKRVRQYLATRTGGKELRMSQEDANTLFEGPVITMPTKYAGMIKVLLLTTFYAPALPFSMIYTIGGMTVYYWAEKYVLLRRVALPNMIGDDLADEMVEYAEWAACTFAVGNIIFIYTLKDTLGLYAHNDTSFALAWVTFGISLVHIFFPMEILNKKMFPIEDLVTEYKTYDEVRAEFNTDYAVENPITHKKAFKDLQAIKKKRGVKLIEENVDILGKVSPGDVPSLFPKKVVSDQEQKEEEPEEVEEGEGEGEEGEEYYDDDDDEVEWDDLDQFADQPKTDIAPNQQVATTKLEPQLEKYGTFFGKVSGQPADQEEGLKNAFFSSPDEKGPLNIDSPIDLIGIANNVQDNGDPENQQRGYGKQESMTRNHQTQESERPLRAQQKRESTLYNQPDEGDSRGERNVEFDPSAVELIGGTFSPDRGQSKHISRIEEQPKDKISRFSVRSPNPKIEPKGNVEADGPYSINHFTKESEENSRTEQ